MEKMTKPAVLAKRHASDDRTARHRPQKRSRGHDLISKLPDDVLGSIIFLLPTKDGVRTQAINRRWRPLWRSAPLNLQADYRLCKDESTCRSVVSRILADHLAPVRRFCFDDIFRIVKRHGRNSAAQIENWFSTGALDSLEELDITFRLLNHHTSNMWYRPLPKHSRYRPLPPCVLTRCASTLVVAKLDSCDFLDKMAPCPWPSFPFLKRLDLYCVSISRDVFLGLLSGCHALESLYLCEMRAVGCLPIRSPSLRSLGIGAALSSGKHELVVEDTPCLERLLLSSPGDKGKYIRVIRAPKLEILGHLSSCIVFEGSLRHSICSVKVMALEFSVPRLHVVLDILRCFPCLEKLYVRWDEYLKIEMKSVRRTDPPDTIKCFESHLKTLVLKNYEGGRRDIGFAKFFLLNAKVLKDIKFLVKGETDKIWMADQYRLLEVENRASRDLQIEFRSSAKHNIFNTHDLSIADPFNFHYRVQGGDVI